MIKLKDLLTEQQEEAESKELEQAMGAAFTALGNEFKNKEAQIKQDVKQSDLQITEAITVISVIGFILALPKMTEMLVKALSKLVNTFKKLVGKGEGKNDPEGVAKLIIDGTHKWHKAYIKGLKWILKISGTFDKAGIKGDAAQTKAAELVYYTIIALLAVYSGVAAAGAFKSAIANSGVSDFSLATFESVLTAIKSGEVQEFAKKLALV